MVAKSNPIKVLIADGHVQYSRALKLTLEMDKDIEIVGEVDDWQSLELAVRKLHPDVILMDIRLNNAEGNNNGIAATRQILLQHRHIAVILLTMLPSNELSLLAHQAGAHALITKDDHNNELLRLIRAASQSTIPQTVAVPAHDQSQYRIEQ